MSRNRLGPKSFFSEILVMVIIPPFRGNNVILIMGIIVIVDAKLIVFII